MNNRIYLIAALISAGCVMTARAAESSALLWYDKPAAEWVEALPVGNGSLGGMVFGGVTSEHVQFNEQTLWTGDEIKMGNYQPFGDLYIDFADVKATAYRRELDLNDAVQRTIYTANGVKFIREVFSSNPDQVMVVRLTADKPGSISCKIRLTDAHNGKITVGNNSISCMGALDNQLAYESRIAILNENGVLKSDGQSILLEKADSATILLSAATSFANSPAKAWRGEPPSAKLDRHCQRRSKSRLLISKRIIFATIRTSSIG